MGTMSEKTVHPRPPRAMTQWLFRPYWKRVRIQLGDRVYVSRSSRGPPDTSCSGRLRFWGKIHCAEGYWAGVELDFPKGQNDGAVDGRRYFLCQPKRGLFVRIARCRTRAGYSVGDGRHVSFSSRTLGKKSDDADWNTILPNQNTPFATAAHNARNGSAPPYLSEVSRRDGTCLASGQPRRERAADSRLNAVKWVPIDRSETHCGGSRHFELSARRHEIQLESDSSESSSSESVSSGSDRSQIDLDQVLDHVLAAPANREDTAKAARFGELIKDGSCSRTAEAAEVERRREALINSYSRWASSRDRRRERDQASTVGSISFSDDSSTQRTVGEALDKRCGAATEKRKQDTSEVGMLAGASDHGRPTVEMSTAVAARNDRNDRALVLFCLSASASRQLLLHRSLRRARVLRKGNIMHDLSSGTGLGRETSPFRGLPLVFDRPSQPDAMLLHAPSPAPSEVTERALADITEGRERIRSVAAHPRARGTRVCVVACAASGMPGKKALSTLDVTERSSSNTPPEAAPTATALGWPEDTKKEIEHPLEGPSLDIIPSRRSPVVGADRFSLGSTSFAIARNSPSASGHFAGENRAGEGDKGERKLSEAGQESLPTLTGSARLGGGALAATSGWSSCRDVTVWTRAMASEGAIVEINFRNSVCGLLPCSTDPDCRNTTSTGEDQIVARLSPDHRNEDLRGEVTDSNLDALTQVGKTAVAMAVVPRLPNTGDDEQRQMIPFQGCRDMPGAGAEHTTVILPTRMHSGTSHAKTPRSQPRPRQVGSDQYSTGGGSEGGGRLLCDARPPVDDVNNLRPSPADTCTRQRRIGQSATPRGFHPPRSQLIGPAAKVTGVDSILPENETRIVQYTKPGCAARTWTRNVTKKDAEGELPHPALAVQGKRDGRRGEPWSNRSAGSVGTLLRRQDLGLVELPPASEGVVGPRNLVDVLRANDPAKTTRSQQHAEKGQRRNATPAPARAEGKISSGNAAVSGQVGTNVADQHDDGQAKGLCEAGVAHNSNDGGQPEREVGVLSTPRGGMHAGELRTSIGHEVSSVSPPGTPGNLLTVRDGPQPQTETQPPAVDGTENCGLVIPLHPQACLQISPPCSSFPLPFPAPGESAVRQIDEHDDTEQAAAEPVSAAPVEGTIRENATMKPTPAGSSAAAPPSSGSTSQPPLSSPLPLSPPPIRPKQSAPPPTAIADTGAEQGSIAELFSTVTALGNTNADDDGRALSAPVVHRRRYEDHGRRWPELCAAARPGCAEREDIKLGCEKPAYKLVSPRATQTQSKHEKPVAMITAAAGPGQNTAVNSCQASPPALQRRQASESTVDLESRGEICARASEQSDGSKSSGKERRQRHRERYPPPPGPPPSPTPGRRRRTISPTRCCGSRSRSRSCERPSSEREGGRQKDTAGEETCTVEPPTIELTGEDDNTYASSPRPFQAKGCSMPTNGQEDPALRDLAGVAGCWLPPPTPPPPEARRRRRARQSSPSPTALTSSAPRVRGGAPPPPPPFPFPQKRREEDGEKQHYWSARPEEKEREDQTQTRRYSNSEAVDGRDPKVGYRSRARRSENEARGTTESERTTGGKGSPSLSLGDNRDRRKNDRKGSWASSYEGSAAKRRANEVLARIAALEVSFDRVEERAGATAPANVVVRGDSAFELRTANVRNNAASEPDAPSAAGAATSNMALTSILYTAEKKRGVPQTGLPIHRRCSKDNVGNASGALCPPPSLSKEERRRAREEQPISTEGPDPIISTGSPSEGARRPGEDVAFPLAMRESDQPSPAGRNGGSTRQQSEFYFNLGRRMMLDSFE